MDFITTNMSAQPCWGPGVTARQNTGTSSGKLPGRLLLHTATSTWHVYILVRPVRVVSPCCPSPSCHSPMPFGGTWHCASTMLGIGWTAKWPAGQGRGTTLQGGRIAFATLQRSQGWAQWVCRSTLARTVGAWELPSPKSSACELQSLINDIAPVDYAGLGFRAAR